MANFFKNYHEELKIKREEEKQNNTIEKLTAQDIETAIIEFLENQPETKYGEVPFPEVDYVKPFKDYLCTNNNGVVIDLKDGIQVCLTIQLR